MHTVGRRRPLWAAARRARRCRAHVGRHQRAPRLGKLERLLRAPPAHGGAWQGAAMGAARAEGSALQAWRLCWHGRGAVTPRQGCLRGAGPSRRQLLTAAPAPHLCLRISQ